MDKEKETQETIVKIDEDSCIGCGDCVRMCPQQILYIGDDDVCHVTEHSRCDRLRGCERACPTEAIKIV
jgi:NAD-dependent dihydropyrimidine dehydrogenase PreA subunit